MRAQSPAGTFRVQAPPSDKLRSNTQGGLASLLSFHSALDTIPTPNTGVGRPPRQRRPPAPGWALNSGQVPPHDPRGLGLGSSGSCFSRLAAHVSRAPPRVGGGGPCASARPGLGFSAPNGADPPPASPRLCHPCLSGRQRVRTLAASSSGALGPRPRRGSMLPTWRSPYRSAAAARADPVAEGAKPGCPRRTPPSCCQRFTSNQPRRLPLASGRQGAWPRPVRATAIFGVERSDRSPWTPLRLCSAAHFRRPAPSARGTARQRPRCPHRKRKLLELLAPPRGHLGGRRRPRRTERKFPCSFPEPE